MRAHRLTTTLSLGVGLTLAFMFLLSAGTATPGQAAIIGSVNAFADGIQPGDGACTLREAINNATANGDTTGGDCAPGAGGDVISLAAGTYVLTVTGASEDHNASGDLDLTGGDALTIAGQGADLTVIDAGGIDRVFDLFTGTVVLSGVTVSGGVSTSGGGGIENDDADLTLVNVAVRHNVATDGGGIQLDDGRLLMVGGEFSDNRAGDEGGALDLRDNHGAAVLTGTRLISNYATSYGGGVYVSQGNATLSGVQILSNVAQYTGGGASVGGASAALTITGGSLVAYNVVTHTMAGYGGGGLAMDTSTGRLWVFDAEIRDNDAVAGGGLMLTGSGGWVWMERTAVLSNVAVNGGGINNYGDGSDGSLTLVNCTVTRNRAGNGGLGGGIFTGFQTTTRLTYTTIVSNVATGGGLAGGGLHQALGATATLRNTLLSENLPRNCGPGIASNGNNLDDGNSCALAAGGDITRTDPALAQLAQKDGAWVRALTEESPARDAGVCLAAITTDQRGRPRPETGCDIGAYELTALPLRLPALLKDS